MIRGDGPAVALAVVLFTVVALTIGIPGTAATSHYDISLSKSVETPPRTVEFQNKDYDIEEIGRVEPGESLTATVTAPSGDSYDLTVYNSDKQIVTSSRQTGTSTVTISTNGYTPGTYVVTVFHDGTFQTVAPLVVSGYAVSIDADSSALNDSTLSVGVQATQTAGSKSISQAKIVIGNANDDTRKTLSRSSYTDFRTNMSLSGLGDGDYSIYAVVQGSDDFLGNKEMLGVSDSQSLSIVTPTPTPTPTPTLTPTGNQSNSSTPTSTPSPTPTPTPSNEADDEEEAAAGGAAGGGPPALVSTPTEAETEAPSPTPQPTEAVEPDQPTANPPSTGQSSPADANDQSQEDDSPGTAQSDPNTEEASSPTADQILTPNPTDVASPAPTPSPGQSLGFLPLITAFILVILLVFRRR